MNTAFLKSVFSVEQFANDYKKFLSTFYLIQKLFKMNLSKTIKRKLIQ